MKKVSKDPGSPVSGLSGSRWPSGLRPCSSRYLEGQSGRLEGYYYLEMVATIKRNSGGGKISTIPMQHFRAERQLVRYGDGRPKKTLLSAWKCTRWATVKASDEIVGRRTSKGLLFDKTLGETYLAPHLRRDLHQYACVGQGSVLLETVRKTSPWTLLFSYFEISVHQRS